MKKNLLLCLMVCFLSVGAFGQCEADQFWIDNYVYGVFPYPPGSEYDDGSVSEGIPTACAGQEFNFDFTIIVPLILPGDIVADLSGGLITTDMPLDSVVLSSPNDIGLPDGYTFVSDADGWRFNGGEEYCARITGMSETASAAQPISLAANAYSPALLGQPFPVEFDGYSFSVVDDATLCAVAIEDLLESQVGITNYPNPFSEETTISFYTDEAANFTLEVFNVTGKMVSTREFEGVAGTNSYVFEASDLDSGIYFYTLSDGSSSVTNRMIINK